MREFSVTELDRMEVTQEAVMQDTCELLTFVEVEDEYGVPQKVWSVLDTLQCGLSHSATNSEGMLDAEGGTQVPIETRTLRLPADTVVSNLMRVRITHRFNVEQDDPVTYEIIGDPQLGPSGLLVQVERVTV